MRKFVLGIDGVPYSFLKENFNKGKMPNLSRLAKISSKRMNSVYPTVSCVAWSTYMTGKNPGEHNIFGFADRIPNPFSITIPTARDKKSPTIWRELSDAGKRVIVINVPQTYPPEPVNGILVSCFLCTDINKCSYPESFNNYLKSKGYIIDVDAWLARKKLKRAFMNELIKAMDKRFEITFELMEKEQWDFFQLHIMETDRMFHFFWKDLENKGEYYSDIEHFFEKLDNYIAKLEEKLLQDQFLILSDHGFCGMKYETQLNLWLEKEGLLKFDKIYDKKLPDYHRSSICYSLIPGRIFINLEGREEKGTVKRSDYERVREEIKQKLLDFKNPETNEKVIDRVFFREEIYSGPYVENSADIIAHPVRGYDLKAKTEGNAIFETSELSGMHTYSDAFICGVNVDISSVKSIQDVKKVII